jgi:Fic family protein
VDVITSKEGTVRQYIWQNQHWQDFNSQFDKGALLEPLSRARFLQGALLEKIASLNLQLQTEAQSEILIAETLETSKIEGVTLNIESVRSSVAEQLGFPKGVGIRHDQHTDGVVAVLLDAVRGSDAPLSLDRLNGWHAALFPSGYSGFNKITVADLRKGDMRVVSGVLGREKTHFEAPDPQQVKREIVIFIDWFNNSFGKEDGLLRAASAHLKFVTIHPYDDGNGRLSRALTDMAMAQDEKASFRSYSLSAEIMKERSDYYQILEDVQSGQIGLTGWFEWFIAMFINALENSQKMLANAFYKAAFWGKAKDISINERQEKALKKMLDAGLGGFAGGLTTRKYVSMAKVSTATAFREIDDLYTKGLLTRSGSGRSVKYELSKPMNQPDNL